MNYRALQLGVVLACLLVYGSQGVNFEGWVLLALKRQIIDSLHHLDGWNKRDPTPCAWTGSRT